METEIPLHLATAHHSEFRMRFTSTARGARLARRLTAVRLDEWGHPYDSLISEAAVLVVAELAANAATHGRVQGRDFALRLVLSPTCLRIEVTDTRAESRPSTAPTVPGPEDESGRGLLLVSALATRWGVTDRTPSPHAMPGKTVYAELDLR